MDIPGPRRGGRKRSEDRTKIKDRRIAFRISEGEYRRWERYSQQYQMKSTSEFVRWVMKICPGFLPDPPTSKPSELPSNNA